MKRIVVENVKGLSANVATHGILKTAGAVTASALILGHLLVVEFAGGEDSALHFGSDHLELQASPAPPSPPVGLLVSGAKSPLAIDRTATRFRWCSLSTGR
jgi:hypothetical protein